MEELIPFVFFILWFLFGGLGSKKKREEAQRRAEQAKQTAREREDQRRARMEQRRVDSTVRTAAEKARTEAREAREATAETSVDMIPDELWNILTGGAPRPTQPQPYPSAEREPIGEGGWVTSPPYDEEDAVHSIEGVSAETSSENVLDYDDDADRTARARYEDLRATTWDEKPTSRDAIAVRTGDISEARHDEFHDKLTAFEIGKSVGARRISARERLGLRSLGDLRRAIVLAEILGPPKALR